MKILLLILTLLLSGCATPSYRMYGYQINKICAPKSCIQQAELYADFIGGTIYLNETHAFVVKDGKIYDSMNMKYTGYSINNWQVKEVYGDKQNWEGVA